MDQDRELLIEALASRADGVFVDYAEYSDYGISEAAKELRTQTSDESLIRAALLRSMYGAVETLNLRSTFALF